MASAGCQKDSSSLYNNPKSITRNEGKRQAWAGGKKKKKKAEGRQKKKHEVAGSIKKVTAIWVSKRRSFSVALKSEEMTVQELELPAALRRAQLVTTRGFEIGGELSEISVNGVWQETQTV